MIGRRSGSPAPRPIGWNPEIEEQARAALANLAETIGMFPLGSLRDDGSPARAALNHIDVARKGLEAAVEEVERLRRLDGRTDARARLDRSLGAGSWGGAAYSPPSNEVAKPEIQAPEGVVRLVVDIDPEAAHGHVQPRPARVVLTLPAGMEVLSMEAVEALSAAAADAIDDALVEASYPK